MIAPVRHARAFVERSRDAADERGVVVVWLAIMIIVFLGVAAFAVDIAYWHLVKGREQRAADAAALAGAVSFPGNRPGSDAAAKDIAAKNGYSVASVSQVPNTSNCPLGSATTVVCTGPGKEAFQYRVTIVQSVENIFGGIFGLGRTTIRATATAEYLKPLSMGSPSNQFGNDPDKTSWPINASSPPITYPNIWANIEGGGTAKQQGDAYAANWCDTSNGNLVTDGCSGSGDGRNNNFTANGYYYTVDFSDNATTDLQVFDPAMVHTRSLCDAGASVNLAGAAALANIPNYPQGSGNTADIQKRFRPPTNLNDPTDAGFQYCTGDQSFPNSAGASPTPTTTYTVWKATVPGDPSTAQQVCAPVSYPGYNGDVAVPLAAGTTLPGAPKPFAEYFRQWVDLCSVTGSLGDEYFIQVQTDNGSGSNHFSFRGVDSGGGASPVTIAGNTYMSLFANVGSNQLTKFYLARVPSAAKGHTLVLNFYDIGDANSQGTLQVRPPSESGINTFSGCTWTGGNGSNIGYTSNTSAAPWGDDNPIDDCLITGVNNVSSSWNAQWSTVTVPIPHDYTCNDDDPFGCWLTIDYKFNGQVHDVTSWNAYLLGDPVRLTE